MSALMMEVTFDSLPFLVSENQREEMAHYRELALRREQEMAHQRRLKNMVLREYVTRRLKEMEIKSARKVQLSPTGSFQSSKTITSQPSSIPSKNETLLDQGEDFNRSSLRNSHPESPKESESVLSTVPVDGPRRHSHIPSRISLAAVWPTSRQRSSWAPIVPSTSLQPSHEYAFPRTVTADEVDMPWTSGVALPTSDRVSPVAKTYPPPTAFAPTYALTMPTSSVSTADQSSSVPSQSFSLEVTTEPLARWSLPVTSHPPLSQSPHDQENARLAAIARGFLTRRMLDSEKIRNIITTIRDAESVLKSLDNPATPQDFDLQQRVASQLQTSKMRLHDIFFALPTSEQMAFITHSRLLRQERTRRRQADDKKARLSTATVRSIARRRQTISCVSRNTRNESKTGVSSTSAVKGASSKVSSTSARQGHSQPSSKTHPQVDTRRRSSSVSSPPTATTHPQIDTRLSLASNPPTTVAHTAQPKHRTAKKTTSKRQLPVVKQQKPKPKQSAQKESHVLPPTTTQAATKGTRIPVLQNTGRHSLAAPVSSHGTSSIQSKSTASKLTRGHSTHKKTRYS